MTVEAIGDVDGRTRRRRRNIDAVVDAIIELAGDGNPDPTSEEIAAVAGVSHRSIYRYFDTRADLLEAAVVRAFETATADVFDGRDPGGSFAERVDRFASARLEISRRLRDIVRVAHSHHASAGVERARTMLRMHLVEEFATEIAQLDPDERRLALPVIDAAFQFEALEYLSGNAEMDDDAIRQSLARHVHRHLMRI